MKTINKISHPDRIQSVIQIGNAKTFQQMSDVLSILSKFDALEIFVLAKDGIKSELDTPQKIGLTKKQYYTRLKQLYDLNLITKRGNAYIHTSFGSLIYNEHIISFLNILSNIKELEMIDVLKKSSKFNNNEISEFLSRVSPHKHAEFTKNIIKKTVIVNTFDGMVSKVLETIEFAQHEILIASRFTNDLIINSVLKKSTTGVKVKILADTNTVRGFFNNAEKAISKHDKNDSERTEVVANPFYPSNIERRYVNTPFSLLVVDNKNVGIEIVDNYNPEKFTLSVHTEDRDLAQQIKSSFDEWWEGASLELPQFIYKIDKRS